MPTIDPRRITPQPGRAVVKRVAEPVSSKLVYTPEVRGKQAYYAEVVAINVPEGDDAEQVKAGDKVWYSANVGEDDSAFLTWGGEKYAIIPADAILLLEVA